MSEWDDFRDTIMNTATQRQPESEPPVRIGDWLGACLRYINNTPELLSLLYDLDLLPEQLQRGTHEWKQMLILANWHHRYRRKRPNKKLSDPASTT